MAGNRKQVDADIYSKEPLFGFLPRKVNSEQVTKAMVRRTLQQALCREFSPETIQDGDVNPFTKRPHTPQYKKILAVRKKLPVYAQMEEFYNMVSLLVRLLLRGASEPVSQVTLSIKAPCH